MKKINKFVSKFSLYKEEIDRIKKVKGKLTAKILVDEAKKKDNPLHNFFEWDNGKAGVSWRLQQARVLINLITYDLITSKGKKKIYRYELIKTNGNSEYLEVDEILTNKKFKEQIIQQALKELEYWKKKYEIYAEFKPIVKQINKITNKKKGFWGFLNK